MAYNNTNLSLRRVITSLNWGVQVEYDMNPIPNGVTNVFNVVGGRVLLIDLQGIVTTQLQAAALTLEWDHIADIGANPPLSVASADLTGTAVGMMMLMPATAAGAMTVSAAGGYLKLFPEIGWVLNTGSIALDSSAARTGGIKWTAYYIPLDDGAYLEAA